MCLCCCCGGRCCDCILVLIAFVFPPLPVIWKRGCCSVDLLINLLLCTLGLVPGIIHSWLVILDDSRASNMNNRVYDEERQLYVVLPPNHNMVINKQPRQTRITFQHPEPFLENHIHNNSNSSSSNVVNDGSNLSPLTRDYGSLDDNSPPPSYDNVMNNIK